MRGTGAQAPRKVPLKFRASETRIGRLLLPLAALVATAYATFLLFDAFGPGSAELPHLAASGAVAKDALPSVQAAAAAEKQPAGEGDRGTIHVMATSNGSPYLNWQTQSVWRLQLAAAAASASAASPGKSSLGCNGSERAQARDREAVNCGGCAAGRAFTPRTRSA